MKIPVSNTFQRTFSLFIILLTIQLIFTSTLIAQSITVTVKDESPLEIEQIDVYVRLTETESKYVRPKYPGQNTQELISAEMFLNGLSKRQVQSNLIESEKQSNNPFPPPVPPVVAPPPVPPAPGKAAQDTKPTKRQTVQTKSQFNFHVIIDNYDDLNYLKETMHTYANIGIYHADFKSKNENVTLKKLTKALILKAEVEARQIANFMDMDVTQVSNIKVINKQTKGNPLGLMMYILEQKAYMEIDVTFETDKL